MSWLITAAFFFISALGADIVNPSFELGLTGWTASPPSNIAVVSSYTHIPTGTVFNAKYGSSFARVTAGAQNVWIELSQVFAPTAPYTVGGYYFFAANDILPFNDESQILVDINLSAGELLVPIVQTKVSDVGSLGVKGWTFFSYTFPVPGTYTIKIRIRNIGDSSFSSVIGLDLSPCAGSSAPPCTTVGTQICRSATSYGTCALYTGSPCYGPEQFCQPGLICQPSGSNIYCVPPPLLPGACTIGHMKCLSSNTYTTCAAYTGSPAFGPTQTCAAGHICQTSGNYIYCVPPPAAPGPCTVGDMKCLSPSTFTTCALYTGSPAFGPTQSCGAGTTCTPSGNKIYCLPNSGPGVCTVGHMKCNSLNTYSTCALYSGSPAFGPIQTCQPGLHCQVSGNYIYCV